MKKIIRAITSAIMLASFLAQSTVFSAGENIVVNGDFESGELLASANWKYPEKGGWYGDLNSGESGQLAARVSDKKHGGDYAAKVCKGAIGQKIDLSAGKYRLSAYVLSDGADGKIGIYDGTQEWPINSSYCIASAELSDTDGEWKEVTMDIECSSAKAYVAAVTANSDTTVYIDDVTVTQTEYNSNGIVNGDFSDGAEGWSIKGSATFSDGVLTLSQGESEAATLSQNVTGLENGAYNLTVHTSVSEITANSTAYVYAKSHGHTIAKTPIIQSGSLQKAVVPNVTVTDGECEIGIYTSGGAVVSADNFAFSKTEETRVPLLKGGEISKLTFIEKHGGEFYRADGSKADALQIMAENGFNLARIRVLDNPGKGRGDGSYYLPEGYQNEEDCLSLARRAKDKGMQILFSFAYSDYWVDGEKQIIPYSWQNEITDKGLSGEEKYKYLENKTYEYTKDIMQKLIAQGTRPEYVSIGNEIQVGIFFGNQKDKNCMWDSALYNKSNMLARFLNAGARAVREVSPETKIVLHSDNGGKLSKRSTFKNALNSIDYDVIGVSYYPYYNSDVSIDNVVSEFNSLISTYNKDVMIMETGYNWNELRGDGWEGQLEDSGYYQTIYGETQQGQRAFLTELYTKLMQVSGGRCIGDCYWDPVMIGSYSDGVGWAISEDGDYVQGNVVSNSTIFDFDGKAVAGQLAMRDTSNSTDNISITGTVSGDGSLIKNTRFTFTVNGRQYNTSTDSFGEYIVSVPYPQDGRLEIRAGGCTEKIQENAPSDGILLNGVDFATYTVRKQPMRSLDDKFSVENITDGEGKRLHVSGVQDEVRRASMLEATYNSDGTLKKLRIVPYTAGDDGIITDCIDEPQTDNGESYKLMLWDDNNSPLISPIQKEDGFFE